MEGAARSRGHSQAPPILVSRLWPGRKQAPRKRSKGLGGEPLHAACPGQTSYSCPSSALLPSRPCARHCGIIPATLGEPSSARQIETPHCLPVCRSCCLLAWAVCLLARLPVSSACRHMCLSDSMSSVPDSQESSWPLSAAGNRPIQVSPAALCLPWCALSVFLAPPPLTEASAF